MDKTLVIIQATRRDGLDVETYTFEYFTPSFFCRKEPEAEKRYFAKVVKTWLSTEDGMKAFEDTMEDFNWLDIPNYIPDTWFAGYGLHLLKPGMQITIGDPACIVIEVNADEVFEPEEVCK